MSGGYTRLTVHGTTRRAQVVVPDDEPVAGLLPDLLDLLDEDRAAGSHPLTLVGLLGDQVDPARSLAEQGVPQGALLRLVRVDQAPPPPEVADVTDAVTHALAARTDRWTPAWSRAVAAALAGVAAAVGVGAAAEVWPLTPAGLLAVAAALAVVAVVLARARAHGPAVVLAAASVGGAVAVAPALAGQLAPDLPGATVLTALACAGTLVALVAGVGAGRRAPAAGAALGAVLAAGCVALSAAAGPSAAVGATAVLCALVLGLLPGVAMTVSGLSGLDDRAVAGTRPPRAAVLGAVDATYRALTWSTVAVSAVAAVCAWALVTPDEVWSNLLGAVVGLVVVLRARVLPLVAQRLATWSAGAVVAAGWALAHAARDPQAVLVGVLVVLAVAAVVAGVRPTGPVAARARRAASLVETLAAVAAVPLLLAHLGVFADLLGTFR